MMNHCAFMGWSAFSLMVHVQRNPFREKNSLWITSHTHTCTSMKKSLQVNSATFHWTETTEQKSACMPREPQTVSWVGIISKRGMLSQSQGARQPIWQRAGFEWSLSGSEHTSLQISWCSSIEGCLIGLLQWGCIFFLWTSLYEF